MEMSRVRQFRLQGALLDLTMKLYYVVPRISGTLCLFIALGLSYYLFRIELLVPLLFAGGCLINMSEFWKRLRLEKNAVFTRAEKYIVLSIRILGVGFVVNLVTATVGTVLHTGFSPSYTTPMTFGVALALAGMLIGTGGIISARSKLPE